MTDLSLAEKVEGLTCPCRETDAEIDRLLCPNVADGRAGNGVRMAPPYTASLDAVVALIEKELPDVYHSYARTALRPGMIPGSSPWPYRGEVGNWGTPSRGNGRTPALALLAALLRAKGEQNG